MRSKKKTALEIANQWIDNKGKISNSGPIKESEIISFLEGFGLPLCDSTVEELIKSTLSIDRELTDRDIIWAVYSALLCPLYQSIGSCFATAPAILIHREQPLQFLKDLKDLLITGNLSRTFGGNAYTVPINVYSQSTDQHQLLKTWEYTLASFVDVKAEFSSWNLYASLGLEPEQRGGIGEVAYQFLNEKLEEANGKVHKYQAEYEAAYDQVKTTESLLRGATTETDLRRLKAELQGRVYQFEACEEMRDKYHIRAHNIANYFSFFIKEIINQFQKYFQEVYDPQIHTKTLENYEDAPAGFRLLYKHGRTHVGSWTLIHTSKEYIQALRQFFTAIEPILIEESGWKEGKKEITNLITAIVQQIGSKEFLESAMKRMALVHKSPDQKPWAYTSGGTLTTLLQTYFSREVPISEESRWVDSPQDLLIFLIETMKKLPPKITELFQKNPTRRMLMASPTHVFSLLPGQPTFREGWEDSGFTYTWVRDQIILPKAKPILFADSNWQDVFFSFVVNQESGELELWRTDPQASYGEPMSEWEVFLNGTIKEPWRIFYNPFEYLTN